MRDKHPKQDADRRGSAVETAADRRRSPRAAYRVLFTLRPLLDDGTVGRAVEVILQDLSLVGMGIIHGSAMREGAQYQIPLHGGGAADADAPRLALLATVVRCEQLDHDLFSIGFEFNSSAAVVDEGSRQLTGRPAPRD